MTVPEVLAELRAARERMQPPIQGFGKVIALSSTQATTDAASALLALFNQRVTHLDASIAALEGLHNDGYPELPDRQVVSGVLDDVNDDLSDITAALGFLKPEQASDLGLSLGQPELK